MASQAKLTIRVSAARGSSTIEYRTAGKYVSFTTAGLERTLPRQAILPTANLDGFWTAVLGLVQADVEAGS